VVESEAFDGVAGDVKRVSRAEFCEEDLGVYGADGVGVEGVVGRLLANGREG
jgi:hypothetical protein